MPDQEDKPDRAQLNARIPSPLKTAVKLEAARTKGPDGKDLTLDRLTEVILSDFFLTHPTQAQRDQFWKERLALGAKALALA